LSGIILKKSKFLDFVGEHVQKGLAYNRPEELLMIVGLEFDRRLKKEMEDSSQQEIKEINQYMMIDYELRADVPRDRFFLVKKKDYRSSKIMLM